MQKIALRAVFMTHVCATWCRTTKSRRGFTGRERFGKRAKGTWFSMVGVCLLVLLLLPFAAVVVAPHEGGRGCCSFACLAGPCTAAAPIIEKMLFDLLFG